MYSLLNLRKTVGPSYNVDPEDVLTLKKALNKTGHYKMPDFGLTPYPDTPLMKGIKSFQKDTGLKQDSTVKPGGPTEKMLAFAEKVSSKSPDNSEKCRERWDKEHSKCFKWFPYGSNAVRGCIERSTDRLRLCNRYGYPEPREPKEWSLRDILG